MYTRRNLIAGAAAALALPRRAWAGTSIALGGQTRIDTLSDGHLVLPRGLIVPNPTPQIEAILSSYGQTGDSFTPDCNVTLLRDGTNTVIFDVGAGPNFMPSAGKLSAAMAELGLDPTEVTHVVFTHAHPDHLWGLLDDFDDPVFPQAEYMIGQREWDYWTDPETPETIGAARLAFAAGASRLLAEIEDQVSFFNDGDEILPGVAAHASFGHTPGHMSFEIRAGNSSALVIGDAIGNHHLAFAAPDIASGADQDPDLGAATRMRLLDKIATDQMQIIGFHLPGGGTGMVERDGAAYRFLKG